MTLAARPTSPRRLAALGLAAMLFAGCSSIPAVTPTPTPSKLPTVPPAAPAFSLAPSPTGCPTAAPAPLSGTATVTMATNFGTIVIKADGAVDPAGAGAFVALAQCGYYNNVIFHRVIPKFVIQAGDGTYGREPAVDLTKVGQGGPDWTVTDNVVKATYPRGTVALGLKGGQANTGNSQFFIVLNDKAFSANTSPYPIAGTVTSGMDVVDKIAQVPTGGEPEQAGGAAGSGTQPLQPVVILTTTVTTP